MAVLFLLLARVSKEMSKVNMEGTVLNAALRPQDVGEVQRKRVEDLRK